jgi:hypothetical protein
MAPKSRQAREALAQELTGDLYVVLRGRGCGGGDGQPQDLDQERALRANHAPAAWNVGP